ncbi:MAG TPA: protein kinase [Kofleriaceae bacterium]|nr:protein kinase [Kofleriaceae bacterium]
MKKKPIPFGKYYLLERINVGGMAEVFRAKAYGVEGFERLVAVKRILPNIAEDKEFIRMFVDEAKIAVQLNHANIAQIFDLGVVDGSYYIALEHVHGRDLRAIFDRCRQKTEPMPTAQACFVMMKVCEGLDYAHNKRDQSGRELNLVHRDVSPQNVLVSFEGEVKLIDFGIAKAAGKGSKTQAGILKGKFGYMSPEQVRGLPIDRRSDIFSCGIVLYELLTGERLFVGESDFSTLEKVRNVEILPPSTYNRRIPDELERIVLKALAKDVEDRYQNAIDLHDELQAFVYTAGEFYSRKDLAAWMKGTFAREIEEETAKLEAYRQIAPPPTEGKPKTTPPAAPGRRPHPSASQSMNALAPAGTKPPPVPANGGHRATKEMAAQPIPDRSQQQLTWDEDELETSIYPDREDGQGPAALPPGRTTAPQPAVLAAQLAAESMRTPRPDVLASTATNWPPPGEVTGQKQALADGSGTSAPFNEEETVDQRGGSGGSGPIMGTSDPSAVVELATLAERHRNSKPEPIYGDLGNESAAFGRAYLSANAPRTRKLKPATIAQIGVTAAVVIAIAILVAIVSSGDDEGGGKKAEATPAPSAAPAAAGAATAADTPQPAVTADPNTGFDLIVDPAGVKVKLDGRPIGKAPLQIRNLTDGDHEVEVEAPAGFFNKTQTVRVTRGQAERVVIQLDAMEVVGKFTSQPPGAKVTLLVDGDKKVLGSTPVDFKLDPRKRYEAVFKKDGYVQVTRAIAMTGAQEVPVEVVLEKGSGPGKRVAAVEEPSPVPDLSLISGGGARKAAPEPKKDSKKAEPRKADAAVPAPAESPEPKEDATADEDGFGMLGISAKPPCRIFIDGRDTGQKTPQVGIKLKAGKHRVTLVNNEFGIKESFTVKITAGETEKAFKDLMDQVPEK